MRFDDRFLEELKARLRPSDVIGRSVKLKRQGREWVGLSPFSKEKSPSFFVNDDKGFFHDFSSGKHGDVISFLQEVERLSFPEAVERLAAEAGMQLPDIDPQAAEREQKRQGLSDWMDLAQKWFAANLRRSVGKAARDYLEKRGLPEDQWGRFGLGYAPNDREGLKAALVQRGARPGDLVEMGMLIAPEGGGAPYDRFRDRLMFPILDARGRIVSFGGRAMNPDDRAKYLNGPESPLFHKGATLYGLPEARRILGAESKAAGQPGGAPGVIVVEGYMDVIACQRAGLPAVAPMGTALTEDQMALLWRVSAEPILCFDGDGAGQRAAYRAIERALPLLKPGRSFRFALLEGGQDPDDILRDKGAPALREAVGTTIPFVELLFRREVAETVPIDTPEREAGLIARLRTAAATIADPDLAKAYRSYLMGLFYRLVRPSHAQKHDAEKVLYRDRRARKPLPRMDVTSEGKAAATKLSFAPMPLVSAIIEGLIAHPKVLQDRMELLDIQGFGDAGLNSMLGSMISVAFNNEGVGPGLLRSRLIATGHDETLARIQRTAKIAHAPFLLGTMSDADAEALLARAIDVLLEAFALSRALDDMKTDDDFEMLAFSKLKAARDAIARYCKSGEVWTGERPTVH